MNLQLFRNPPKKGNEIFDFSMTLQQLGFVGGPKDGEMRATIVYDFKVPDSEPLLAQEPNLMIPDIDETADNMGAQDEMKGTLEANS